MTAEGEGPGQHGSDASLVALYDAVPAAEMLDLREEWEVVQAQQFRDAWSLDGEDGGWDELVDAATDDEVDALTDGQVFGLIEHVLGGELVTDADPDRDEPAGG